jgi:hypothetical protein
VLVIPSVNNSPGLKRLPFCWASIAGFVDVIGFLGLSGLLTAHIKRNLVILAARLVWRARSGATLTPHRSCGVRDCTRNNETVGGTSRGHTWALSLELLPWPDVGSISKPICVPSARLIVVLKMLQLVALIAVV